MKQKTIRLKRPSNLSLNAVLAALGMRKRKARMLYGFTISQNGRDIVTAMVPQIWKHLRKAGYIVSVAAVLAAPVALSEGQPQRRIPLHGVYSAEMGGHWQSGPILTEGQTYRISNNSGETLTVMVLDGSRDMFLVFLNGESRSFVATGIRLDLYTWEVGQKVHGIELRQE